MTLLVRSARPRHAPWLGERVPDALVRARDRASLTKMSTGSRIVTSEIRWSRTSDVTRPMPAPTSSARVLEELDGVFNERNEDGTVDS